MCGYVDTLHRDCVHIDMMKTVAVERETKSEGERSCEEVERSGRSCERLVECRDVVLFSTDTPTDTRTPDDVIISLEADMSWCARLLSVCVRGVGVRYLSACWSTLGGAHSALGECSQAHAVQAGLVSQQQLALALIMGDPLLVARCKLFLAFSLLQQGRVKRAARIIRDQYVFATSESSVYDQKLVDMCLAAWTRVKQLTPLTVTN